VKHGKPVQLVVTRRVERTCATDIVSKDLGVDQALPLDKPVTVKLTPKKAGEYRFACAMDMIAGTLHVE
jgi:plastocyanin domain-containing protein